MADKKMYKVGITVKEPWSADISYEVLDVTLYAVESGGDGCSYTAIKPNQGVTPGTDSTVWVKSTQAGQSIYDLAVKYHHFVGTEEEFEQQYQDALAAANNAASAASATDEQIQANELARVSAENSRVTAERARSDAETARSSAETARINAENARNDAESLRDTAESDRVRAEAGRVTAEASRVEAETFRQGAEQSRRQQFEALKTDMNTAIANVDAKAAEIEEDIEGYEENEAARVSAEQARATAESARVSAESARATAETARETQAASDHTRAETDHGTAASDHTTAQADHTTADADHTLAVSDHTTAAADHTQAGADHTASETATQAATDAAELATEAAGTIDEKIATKADKDGYYPEMRVGQSKSLEGTEVTQVEGITAIAKSTGLAKINEVMGKSLVWNQQVRNGDFSDGTTGWSGSLTNRTVDNGIMTAVSTNTNTDGYISQTLQLTPGHKYYISLYAQSPNGSSFRCRVYVKGSYSDWITNAVLTTSWVQYAGIGTASSSGTGDNNMYLSVKKETTVLYKNIRIIDLTQLFGSGNEPSTVAEFESWLANNIGYRDYYAYNAGEIISNKTEKLEITGLNQWDEEWEVGGIDDTTGEKSTATTQIRSKNFIPCSPSTNYYIHGATGVSIYIYFYDASGGFVSRAYISGSYDVRGKVVTTPSNCVYMMMKAGTLYAYNHDICISVSGSRDGEYEPYQKSELELNLATITGKLNGEGESVAIFPDGLGSVMDAYDRLIVDDDGWCRRAIRTVFSLDLGDLNWTYNKNSQEVFSNNGYASLFASGRNLCAKYTSPESSRPASMPDKSIAINASPLLTSGNFSSKEIVIKDSSYTVPADLKASLTGVKLYYEGYPQEYVLDTPIQMTFQAKHGGVIRQLPENGSEPTTAPMRMSVTYALDAVSILTDLPENYVSKESLQAMLSAMQSAGLFSAYTMTFNESTGKYEFTFTANA